MEDSNAAVYSVLCYAQCPCSHPCIFFLAFVFLEEFGRGTKHLAKDMSEHDSLYLAAAPLWKVLCAMLLN